MVTCQDRRLRRCLVVGLGDGSQKKLFQSAANWCWDIDLHWVSMYFQKKTKRGLVENQRFIVDTPS